MEKLWKFIFNTNHILQGNSINTVIETIRKSGYKLFSWNGEIYRVPNEKKDHPMSQPIGINVEDIEGE